MLIVDMCTSYKVMTLNREFNTWIAAHFAVN